MFKSNRVLQFDKTEPMDSCHFDDLKQPGDLNMGTRFVLLISQT